MDIKVSQKNRLKNKAIAMFIIMLLSKALGFLRDIVMAYKFGTSDIVDAYTVAITLPSVLFAVFISGLNQSYLPYYTRLNTQERKQQFFSNTLIIYVVFALLVTVVSFFLKETIASLLAPGFDKSRHKLCASYVGIIIWMFPFYSLFALMSTQLQTLEDFSVANICDFIVVNTIVIISIFLASPSNSSILAIGYSLSMVVASLILTVYFVRRANIRFTPKKDGALTEFRNLMIIAIPVGLSFMVNQLNSVTDSIFSSTFNSGVTSGLNYANKMQSIFLVLTTTVFMTVVFPRLNIYFAHKNYEDGMYYIRKGIQLSSLLSIPFAVFISVYSKDLIITVFQRGAFDDVSTAITSSCLSMYAIGIPFYAYVEIGSRTLTALMKQRIILKDTCIAVAFNIVMDYVLMRTIGYMGLSMATSISGVLLFTLYYLDIKNMKLICFNKEMLIEIVKMTLATLVATLSSLFFKSIVFVSTNVVLSIIMTAAIFGVVYISFCVMLKTSIINWLITSFRHQKGD